MAESFDFDPRRRRLVKGAATAAGILLGIGAGIVLDRGRRRGAFARLALGPAYDAWQDWEDRHFPGALALVNGAILAASPHNTQPWRFRLDGQRLLIFADPERRLRVVDPFDRERLIGLGCAIENLVVSASGLGFNTRIEWFPDIEPNLVAGIALSPAPPVDSPQFRAIGRRHTNRGAYLRQRPLAPELLAVFTDLVDEPATRLLLLPADQPEGKRFAQATITATEQLVADPMVLRESHRWYRQTPVEANRYGDGVTLSASGLSDTLVRLALLMPGVTAEEAGRYWLKGTREQHCATAPLFGLIAVPKVTDAMALLGAGRLWQRLHLEATARGVAMQPLNQMMEWADRDLAVGRPSLADETLASLIAEPGWRAVFGFRAGWPARPAHPSPRRPVDRVTELL